MSHQLITTLDAVEPVGIPPVPGQLIYAMAQQVVSVNAAALLIMNAGSMYGASIIPGSERCDRECQQLVTNPLFPGFALNYLSGSVSVPRSGYEATVDMASALGIDKALADAYQAYLRRGVPAKFWEHYRNSPPPGPVFKTFFNSVAGGGA